MREQEWLSERIWDIMHLKNITLKMLYPKADLNSAMGLLRLLDDGNITPTILSKIASGLGVSVPRLEMTDRGAEYNEMILRLNEGNAKYNKWTVEKAYHYVNIAVGAKEKAEALRYFGWALFHLNEHDSAIAEWQKAYKIASKKDSRKRHKGQIIDKDLAFQLVIDISVAYIEKSEYETAKKILENSSPNFLGDYLKLGMIHQNRGLCLSKLGDKKAAREHYLISYDCYEKCRAKDRLGRIQLNLATLEFLEGHIHHSKELLEIAKENLANDTLVLQCTVDKDLARVLINLGEFDKAEKLIDANLSRRDELSDAPSNLIGKLLLMKTDLSKDPTYAEQIFSMMEICRELKCNASDLLTEIYMRMGDKDKAMQYYNLMKGNLLHGLEDYKMGAWV